LFYRDIHFRGFTNMGLPAEKLRRGLSRPAHLIKYKAPERADFFDLITCILPRRHPAPLRSSIVQAKIQAP